MDEYPPFPIVQTKQKCFCPFAVPQKKAGTLASPTVHCPPQPGCPGGLSGPHWAGLQAVRKGHLGLPQLWQKSLQRLEQTSLRAVSGKCMPLYCFSVT